MKLVYRIELEVPENVLALDVGQALKWVKDWLSCKGWKVKINGPNP